MDQHRHSPQPTDQFSWDPVRVGDYDPEFSTQLRSLLVSDAGIFHDTWDNSPLLSMTRQHRDGYFSSIIGQVDAIANNRTPVVAGSSNHQPSPEFSHLDKIFQGSVDESAHQRPFMVLWSLSDVFPGPQTRVGVSDAQFAVQVDSMAGGAQRKRNFARDTNQIDDHILNESLVITDVVANSSAAERYKTEIPMMPFGGKLLPDNCSYLPAPFRCSTSGSKRLRTKYQEADRAEPTHDKGGHLVASVPAPCLKSCTPQDRGMRVEKMAKGQYQCSSCGVIFAQRQGLSRHRKDKHEPKNQCGFCKDFTWSKGRYYMYQRHLREEHPDAVQSPSVSVTLIARR
ncbi:hypothetical protein H4582DRAFT_1982673, partial [Lactarius indigo]